MKRIILIASLILLPLIALCQQQENTKGTYILEPMELIKFESIKLLDPDLTGGNNLMRVLSERQSNRDFKDVNLSLKHLSEILWAANGINRADGKRTVPSAMALYPIEIYIFLANGIYQYSPEKHELQAIKEGDYREICGRQPFVKDASMNLVLIANYNKYEGKYDDPETRLSMASLDAAHCTQNVYLYCASEQLKVVVRAGAQVDKIIDVLGLDKNYQFIVAQSVGY